MAEIAGDQRKQVARLLVRIAPDCEVAAGCLRFARGFKRLPLDKSTGSFCPIRFEAHAIGREHVRAVEKIGDAAKPLRLALSAIG